MLGIAAVAMSAGVLTGWQVQRTPSAELDALIQARSQDDEPGWQTFLQAHPDGNGAGEARSALQRLVRSVAKPVAVPAPAPPEDQALLRRLAGRIEQLQESIAGLEHPAPLATPVADQPATGNMPGVAPAPVPPLPVQDPRIREPRTALPGLGVGIAIAPSQDRLVRWTADGVVHGSRDGGLTWTAERQATPGLMLDRHGQRGPISGSLFIAAQPGMAIMGLVGSADGRTWREQAWPWTATNTTDTAVQPAIIAGDGRVLVLARAAAKVQCWTSADGGRSWKTTTVFPGTIGIAPTAAGFVMLAVEDGKLGSAHSVDAILTVFSNQPNVLPQGPVHWDTIGNKVHVGDQQGREVTYVFSHNGTLSATDYPGGGAVNDLQQRRLLRMFADGLDGKQRFSVHPQLGLVRSDSQGRSWNASSTPRQVRALVTGTLAGEAVLAATGEQTVVISLAKPVFDLFLVRVGAP